MSRYKKITMKLASLALLGSFFLSVQISAKESISFPSNDGLQITADTYFTDNKTSPLIVLFHQAGWSRGEYLGIAPKLNKLGFNVLAVDVRSGNKVNGVINQTAKRARKAGKGVSYLDAQQDIESTLLYARKLTKKNTKIIAWGSSYSAALILQIAGNKPKLVDALLAFSPGEYFKRSGKSADWVQHSAQFINVPVFISSAKSEKRRWQKIFTVIKGEKTSFLPETKGNYGSRALWEKYSDSNAYWSAVSRFLQEVKTD